MKNLPITNLFFILIVFLSSSAYTQSVGYEKFESSMEFSEVAVYGEIISTIGFYVPNTRFIFTKNTLRVDANLKGNSTSEITFLTRGGVVEDVQQEWTHAQSFEPGNKGHFFLEEIAAEGILPSSSFLQPISVNSFIPDHSKYRDGSTPIALGRSTAKTLEFEFGAVSYNGSAVTFDILAKASENLYMGQGDIFLSYPTEIFQTNAVANEKVTANPGVFLESYGYDIILFDNTEEMMKVVAGNGCNISSFGRSTRSPFTTSFQKMASISIDVSALSLSGLISMDEFNMTDAFFYIDSLNQCHAFDQIIVPNPIDLGLVCSITSFTDSVRAGVGDILTINGTGFGPLGATVMFFDADDINDVATFNANSNDILSWNDTLITLLVPTTPGVAATGQFSVTTSTGMVCPSIDTLYVEYAVRNNRLTSGPSAGMAERLNLYAPSDNDGKIILRPGPVLDGNALAKASVEKAICDWNSVSKLNFELGAVEPMPSTSTAGQNNIFFATAAIIGAPDVLAQTVITSGICTNTGGPGSIIFAESIDVLILENLSTLPVPATWNFDNTATPSSTEYDFFGIVKHELGHLHMLRHTKFDSSIMVPASFPGDTSYRVIYERDIKGATFSVLSSLEKMNSSFACFEADTASLCITTSIREFLTPNSEIKVYPNPTKDNLVVDLTLSRFIPQLNLSLMDVTGKRIINRSIQNLVEGNNQITVDGLSGYPPGIYFLALEIDGEKSFKRIILQ